MSLHVNNHAVTQPFDLTASLETHSPSLLTPGRQAVAQTVSTAFRNSLTQIGITGQTRDAAVNTFTATFSHTSGIPAGDSPATQQVIDASFRSGNLAPSSQNLTDSITKMTIALGAKGQQQASGGGSSGGGGESWLEAIAKAMGQALGTMAQNLVTESNQLSSLSGNSSSSGAQQFQTVMAQFQAHSQLFGMLSDAFSNAIKSIGQGMQTMGSKT
jgi:hypothetical protein